MILILSLGLRLAAFVESLVLLRRTRDWRMVFLTLLLVPLTLQQGIVLVEGLRDGTFDASVRLGAETVALLVSIAAALAVYFTGRVLTDLTDTRGRLRTTEATSRLVTDHTSDYIMLIDLDGTLRYINRTVDPLTVEGVLGTSTFDHVEAKFHPVMRRCYDRVAETKVPDRYEVDFDAGDGNVIAFESRVAPVLDDDGNVEALVVCSSDVTHRKRAESELKQRSEMERLLYRELDHRVRNNLASLITLISMTERSADDLSSFSRAIQQRVSAMASVHTMLSNARWDTLRFAELLTALVPPDAFGDVVPTGPDIRLAPRQAMALGMVFHELLTNSQKYGALAATDGRVEVTWTVDCEADPAQLRWSWTEFGGPPVHAAPVPGVGTRLIEGLMGAELRGRARLRFPAAGVDHRFEMVPDLLDDDVAVMHTAGEAVR